MSIIDKVQKKINSLMGSKKLPDILFLLAAMCAIIISFLLGIAHERERLREVYQTQVIHQPKVLNGVLLNEKDHQNDAYFFGSQNGSVLYVRDCIAGNRVKEENKVFFSTQAEAESLGYTLSSSC